MRHPCPRAQPDDLVEPNLLRLVRLGRVGAEALERDGMPAMPLGLRGNAARLLRHLRRGMGDGQQLVAEIDDLTSELDTAVANGTFVGWESDEHHVRGGYRTVVLTDDAVRLRRCRDALLELRDAIIANADEDRAARLLR